MGIYICIYTYIHIYIYDICKLCGSTPSQESHEFSACFQNRRLADGAGTQGLAGTELFERLPAAQIKGPLGVAVKGFNLKYRRRHVKAFYESDGL